MLSDFATLDDAAAPDFDVCIIGGGIAGLTLAHELADSALSVGVLEAGGLEVTEAAQALFEGDIVGARYEGHTTGRFRVLGGSSLRWGAQLLPLTPWDLEQHAHVEQSGWPIAHADLLPHYERVERLMRVNALPYDERLADTLAFEPLPFAGDFSWRYSKWARFSNRNVWKLLGGALVRSRSVHVFYNAPVVRLRQERGAAAVSAAAVRRGDGSHAHVRARRFVLCLGTLENARLLLASTDLSPQGIGNGDDNVGRYFHDHVSFRAGRIEPLRDERIPRAFSPRFHRRVMHYPRLELAPSAQEAHGASGVFAHLQFEHREPSAFTAMRAVLRRMQSREWFLPHAAEARSVVRDLPYFARLASSFALGGRVPLPPDATLYLQVDVEQAPNRDSRVYLADTPDALGVPRLAIDWRVTERELHSAEIFVRLLRARWTELGLAPVDWRHDVCSGLAAWAGTVHDTFHQAGTTRMSKTPRDGVVDADSRIHGTDNVFVAGCSVFPTGATANPTFTMMALAVRLAHHLQRPGILR